MSKVEGRGPIDPPPMPSCNFFSCSTLFQQDWKRLPLRINVVSQASSALLRVNACTFSSSFSNGQCSLILFSGWRRRGCYTFA